MFVVLVHTRGKRPQVFGPFGSPLAAADFGREHQDLTGTACEVRPLDAPEVYGEEGL